MNNPLRIGILLDSFDVDAWEYSAIEQIANLDCAEIVLVVLNEAPPKPRSFVETTRRNWHEAGYVLFDKLDRKVFSRQPDAFARKDLGHLLSQTYILKVRPVRHDGIDNFEPDDIRRIREQRLDILARFGFGHPHSDVRSAARFGVWAYHHGDARLNRGAPPGFWETAENWPVTGVTLQRLGRRPGEGLTLHRSWFPTYPFSPAMNRQLFLWTVTSFMSRKIARLHAVGETSFWDEVHKLTPTIDIYDHRLYRTPHNLDVIKTTMRLTYRILARVWKDWLFREQWQLLYQFQEKTTPRPYMFRKMIPPQDRYWADPQILEQNGRYAIFFEDYEYKTDKGRIAVIQINDEGVYSDAIVVLDGEYHLSYPFVFSWQDHHYMIPESAANRTIDLYECTEFPHGWRFRMHLMEDIRAADATLLHYNHKWWLFTTVAAIEGASINYELSLFFADDFISTEWTAHPLNPIVSDVRRARPAGRIFELDGKLIRPSQDSARGYGRSLTFNEIITLSETDYEEQPIEVIKPDWDNAVIGVHTFQRVGKLTMIDALMKQRRLGLFRK